MNINKRWTIDKIKEFVEKNSESKLLSTEYHGFSQKLLFKCACGNKFEKSFTKFKNNHQRKCDVANRQKFHANCITINEALISTIKKLALFIIFSGVNHNDLRKEVLNNGYTSGDGGA